VCRSVESKVARTTSQNAPKETRVSASITSSGGRRCVTLAGAVTVDATDLELVGRFRELVLTKRTAEALQLMSRNVELVTPQGTMGYPEIEELWSGPDEGFDHLELELVPVCLEDVGKGRILAETDYVFRWKETGEISNTEHRAMLYGVENSKIRRMQFVLNPDDAWAAAGGRRDV
jgi:hypothetical protein